MKKKSAEQRIYRIKRTFAIIMMISGICIFAYPFISNYFANRNASVVISDYNKQVSEMDESEKTSIKETMADFNKALDSIDTDEESKRVFQDSEMMGTISIPAINVRLPIYEGTSDETLEKGIGHIEGSSYPIGGKGTHCALSGHRGMSSAELFTYLPEMKVGDHFYLYVLDESLAYEVDQIVTVVPEDTSELAIQPDSDYCTLITCTPLGINSHRLFVRGHRIPYTGEDEQEVTYLGFQLGNIINRITQLWPWLLMYTFAVISVETIIMILLIKRVRREEEED